MNYKEFLVSDLQAEKDGYISTIRNNQLSDEERKVINEKIDALDARIKKANALEDDKATELDAQLKAMNNKFDAIKEKLNAKGVQMPEITNGYLDSKNAMHDFADAMRNAHSNHNKFSDEWGKMLSKNGIAFGADQAAAYLPTPVKGYIEDAWNEYGDVLREFAYVNAKAYYARYTATDQDDEDVRARGYQSYYLTEGDVPNYIATGMQKENQNISLAAHLIQSEYVYKMIPVSNRTIWENDSALIQWVMNELLYQWNYEVLRAILIGDGRSLSDPSHITSIAPITSHINDSFARRYNTAQGSESTIEFMVDHLIEPIHNGDDDVILFVSKADFTAMRKFYNGAGATPTYMSAEDLATMIGVRRIVTVPYLTNSSSGEVRAIAVHAKKYFITGSLTPEFTSWESYSTNERYFRVEIPVGGDLGGLEAAAFAVNA